MVETNVLKKIYPDEELKIAQERSKPALTIRDRQWRYQLFPQSFLGKDLAMWLKQSLVGIFKPFCRLWKHLMKQ
jgi:hypothetical protein